MDKSQRFHFGRAQVHFRNGATSHALRHLRKCTQFGTEPYSEFSDESEDPPKIVAYTDALKAARKKPAVCPRGATYCWRGG